MSGNSSISLAGNWDLSLGGEEPGDFHATISLPGSLAEQGFGEDPSLNTEWTAAVVVRDWFHELAYAPYRKPGEVKVPFFAQARKHFVGPAWFRQEFEIPADWSGQRILLTLERAHIFTTVWVDGVEAGSGDSLGVPHRFELGTQLAPGKHTLLIRVDNRLHLPFGRNAHSVSDHTQSNWNGMVGELTLTATSPVWIEDAQVHPNVETRSIRLTGEIGNCSGEAGQGTLWIDETEYPVHWSEKGGSFAITHSFAQEAELWDEFHPALHHLELRLEGPGANHARTIRFGFREVRVEGRHILLNGRRIFLRGSLECAVFPRTGYAPCEREEWENILRTCREYGFNHLRFHSWCPPRAAFEVADELGFYLQAECSVWTRVGEGGPIDPWLYREAEAMLREYGNHPSFLLMAHGNEPQGNIFRFLRDWVSHCRSLDSRRLYTSSGGWPALPENDFDNIPAPRLQAWAEQMDGPINALPPTSKSDYRVYIENSSRPMISHETGEWCAFPDFRSIERYTGVLQPGNLEIARDFLQAKGLGHLAESFLYASGRLQILLYREEIERALRTPDFAGFQLLQANDFPGQGTALVGWLDAFWQSKGYTSPEEFQRFNAPTVLLARFDRYTWISGERLRVDLELSHFGPEPLQDACVEWKWISGHGETLRQGTLSLETVASGSLHDAGLLELPTSDLRGPEKRTLQAKLQGTGIENSWNFWIYPSDNSLGSIEEVRAPFGWIIAGAERYQGEGANPDVPLVVNSWSALEMVVNKPQKILFEFPAQISAGEIPTAFGPIFWNTSWTRKQKPHTLGILCNPEHPIFASFPTDCHTDWQWWDVLENAHAFCLDGLPCPLEPIVRFIDDWNTSRSLGLVFELQIEQARVLFCGADLHTRIAYRHSARQFRRSLLDYLHSAEFSPESSLTMKDLAQFR